MKYVLFSLLVVAVTVRDNIGGCWAFLPPPVVVAPSGKWRPLFVKETDTSSAPKTTRNPNTKGRKPTNNNKPYKPKNGTSDTGLQNSKRLNRRLVESDSADELFLALQQATGALTKKASGGVMNTVNFSTAVHRLARHSLQARTAILADPRLALLLASLAEALANDEQYEFSCREFSNICWALAKLRIAPPSTALPLNTAAAPDALVATATDVRHQVMQASKAKQAGQPLKPIWIPQLSKLTGQILDEIAFTVDHIVDFKQQEFSNLIWAWATANRPNHQVFGKLIRRMMDQDVKERNPQEWSNVCWAFATAKVYEGTEELFDFLADLTEDQRFVNKFKPQECANSIWGIATLLSNMEEEIPAGMEQSALRIVRSLVPRVLETVNHFKTQELSNTLWGMATLGFGLPLSAVQHASNIYLILRSESPELDKRLKNDSVAAIVEATLPKLHQFRSQELNNLAWSLARLLDEKTPTVESLLYEIGSELCKPRRYVASQDIGTTLWSFASLEFFDDRLYRAILSRFSLDMMKKCKVQEMSNSLWAIATAEIELGMDKDAFDTTALPPEVRPSPKDPIVAFFGNAANEMLERPQHFKPQEIKDFLWSFSKAGIRHPELFRRTAEYLVGREEDGFANSRGLDDFSTQGLGNMAWAFARQAQLAEDVVIRNKSSCTMSLSNGRLAVKSVSCFDIGEGLLHRLFREIAETDLRVYRNLADLKPQDISNTAWAFAALAVRHDGFIVACLQQLQTRTRLYLSGQENSNNYFKGQEISNLLWASATLNAPAEGLMGSIGAYLRHISKHDDGKTSLQGIASVFNRQELANIAWSCAVFGEFPSDLMTFIYGGLLGRQNDPSDVAKVYRDGGIQQQAIMSLLYVQTAMDLCDSTSGLTLPPNFPEGWQQNTNPNGGSETNELTLNTSVMQRSVSTAFKRIGFDHVEEHVISMEGLASEYDVNLPPKAVEVLSIDIANVPRRIAIEVDGPAHFITSINEEGGSTGYTKINKSGRLEYQFTWTGDRQTFNGSTAMKQTLLKKLGWKTINIPFWEWYRLEGPEEEDDYAKQILRQHMDT